MAEIKKMIVEMKEKTKNEIMKIKRATKTELERYEGESQAKQRRNK